MAENKTSIILSISKEQFEHADMLELTERCDRYIGGGYYLMKQYEGKDINQTMWLCQVTAFVFDDIPPQIFVRREESLQR